MNEITKKIAYYILTLLLLISNGGMLYDSYTTGEDEGDKEDKEDKQSEKEEQEKDVSIIP